MLRRTLIATTCPAVVVYVEKYFPSLLEDLAPVVSPMVAMARVMRHLHGDKIRVMFIGPCTAKKYEGNDIKLPGDVDGSVRIIHMGTYDACPCIGEHVKSTGEIGVFRITTTSFEAGILRIRFKLS